MKPITDFPYDPSLLTSKAYFWNRKTKEELAEPTNGESDHQALLAICQENKKYCTLVTTTLPTMHGWCSPEKGCVLFALTVALKPATLIEIGTYAGRSFLPLCWGLRANGTGKAIGIDPYDPVVSSAEGMPSDQEWWSTLDHKLIQKTFLSFLKSFGVESVAHIIEKKSDDVDPVECDLLHVDGGHTDVAIRDAQRFGAKVRLGGVVVLDDIFWCGGSVLRAIDWLEENGFRECYRKVEENWSVMQRIR